MSKTLQKTACFYLPHEDVRKLDELRGIISRSKMGVVAVKRLINDIESGKLVLPSETKNNNTTTKEQTGVRGLHTPTTTRRYSTSYSTELIPPTREGKLS